jgi:hypothetical protein
MTAFSNFSYPDLILMKSIFFERIDIIDDPSFDLKYHGQNITLKDKDQEILRLHELINAIEAELNKNERHNG